MASYWLQLTNSLFSEFAYNKNKNVSNYCMTVQTKEGQFEVLLFNNRYLELNSIRDLNIFKHEAGRSFGIAE